MLSTAALSDAGNTSAHDDGAAAGVPAAGKSDSLGKLGRVGSDADEDDDDDAEAEADELLAYVVALAGSRTEEAGPAGA